MRRRGRRAIDDPSLWAMSRNPVFVEAGRQVFNANCIACHLQSLRGKSENPLAIGPDLTDQIWIHGGHPTDVYRTVTEGVPAKGMPTWGPILGAEAHHGGGGLCPEPPPGGRADHRCRERCRRPSSRCRPPRSSSRSGTSVTTIREDGSRRFLFPADVSGRFARARRAVALVLIAVYFLLPWIPVGGYPAVFLDVAHRRFHLFGLTLAAQDLWLLFFLISGLGFGLFFLTALLGRIWCGWACPQTVFLDQVYRRVERWIDGDAVQRRWLAAAPWSVSKLLRRAAKHAIYLVLAIAITHLFLAYYVSIPAVWGMMRDAPADNWGTFVFIAAATGIVYFDFAWFREQLCIVLCPYGRIQSALTDDHTLVIGYDWARGEPRGKPAAPGAGDCVGCDRCVHVCPTGIDIRQGLQLECVGCSACVDACDEVMSRLGRRPGLIRYDSLAGLAGLPKRLAAPAHDRFTASCSSSGSGSRPGASAGSGRRSSASPAWWALRTTSTARPCATSSSSGW